VFNSFGSNFVEYVASYIFLKILITKFGKLLIDLSDYQFCGKRNAKKTECLTPAHPREAGKNFATRAASPAGARARTKKFWLKIHFYPYRLTTQATYTPVLASNFAWAAGYTYQNRDNLPQPPQASSNPNPSRLCCPQQVIAAKDPAASHGRRR
jgi:hypothetical protein